MPSSKFTCDPPPDAPSHVVNEEHIEYGIIGKLLNLKHEYRNDKGVFRRIPGNFNTRFPFHLPDIFAATPVMATPVPVPVP